MSQLEAWYTREHNIYVTWFCGLRHGFANATFADMVEVREMLPESTAQQIETILNR